MLLYAGLPGRKDLLKEILVALASLAPAERGRIEFRLLGPTRQDLLRLLGRSSGLLDALGDTVKPLGRVPHNRVLAELHEASFAVLLRPDRRYANAGFPTKVPESLAAGAPILLNFTSDLADFLGDGTAVVEIRDGSAAEVEKALRRVLALSQDELQDLRRCARTKAEQHFDYRLYRDSFARYLAHLDS